jgi:putative endonuclease
MIKDYFVCIVECNDGSYYTGITSDLEKRINEHNSGIFNGYTSSRIPVKLVYSNRFTNINEAINAEKQIKGWSRAKKEALIIGDFDLLRKLSKGKNKNGYL